MPGTLNIWNAYRTLRLIDVSIDLGHATTAATASGRVCFRAVVCKDVPASPLLQHERMACEPHNVGEGIERRYGL